MKRRRHRLANREPVELDITAFMNLMVILVPFLLITAVFSRMAILELNVAAPSAEVAALPDDLQLEIIVRKHAVEVADQRGGLIKRFTSNEGVYDLDALNLFLQQIKARFPEKVDANLLLEPQVDYDTIVQVMDSVRVAQVMQDQQEIQAELFPEISIGDAPQLSASARLTEKR